MRAGNPFPLFKTWYREAEAAGTLLPEAMALATATRKGAPSVRMVLHRGFSRGGFVFYTNYNSRKAVELLENPRAAFVFHWPLTERQVRGEGRVEKLSHRESAPILSAASTREPAECVGIAAERGNLEPTVSRGGVRARSRRASAGRTFLVRRSGAASELWQIVSSSGRDNPTASTIALFFDEKEIPGRISGSHRREKL